MNHPPVVAYFSMEIAFENEVPNYAGGLGVLAADTLFAAADMGEPLVAVSLLYHVDEDPARGFDAGRFMTLRPERVSVAVEGRTVQLAIWEHQFVGATGGAIPGYFLSANVPENEPWDRDLSKHLYAPDRYTRLGQEIILGIGGVRALEALGYPVANYHLNEGHAALATLELLRRHAGDREKVRSLVTFTTHTPIPAGHDTFEYELASNSLRDMLPPDIRTYAGERELGMTDLALHLSRRTNSVSAKHQDVCRAMFPGVPIDNVTNGIYAPRWAGQHMRALFDAHLPGWQEDPRALIDAPRRLPDDALALARREEEAELLSWVNQNERFFAVSNVSSEDLLSVDALTIGFARRTVPYKRPDLIFRDIERLEAIAGQGVQLIFASRCHPDDRYCVDFRTRLAAHAERLRGRVKVVLVPDYDLSIAKRLVAGCDVWLNNPVPPLEASGTSGMKAALNGALNLSLRDGWWIEGLAREPESGWGFGGERSADSNDQDARDSAALLDALTEVVSCYYDRGDEWLARMKHAIALGGHFNTHRLLAEYRDAIWYA